MPKPIQEEAKTLRPYSSHGLIFSLDSSGQEALGDCPFCRKDKKFSVNVETGKYRCFACSSVGNQYTFLKTLIDISKETTSKDSTALEEMRSHRGLLDASTFLKWGVVKSVITKRWIVPGFNKEGNLNTVYKYTTLGDKRAFLATPETSLGIYGLQLFDATKPVLYVCEGVWDAMALWEMLSRVKWLDGKLVLTSSVDSSLLSESNVIALPGCNTLKEEWATLFAEKQVIILFDNDHPKPNPHKQGEFFHPPAFVGIQTLAKTLTAAPISPTVIEYMNWGTSGYDSTQKNGKDVRDILMEAGTTAAARVAGLRNILAKLSLIPPAWVEGIEKASKKSNKSEKETIKSLPCDNYLALKTAWRKAMKWIPGLDHGLISMLATVSSTELMGDQLWMKIIGPASCGKSTLCEAISVARKYVIPKSTLRGFHSGFSADEEGTNYSLIEQAKGKTLVIKDGDTLMQSPNMEQILSEARDVYDTVSRSSYRNSASKDHENVRMTFLLCGTSSLRRLDSSELGERFLDCVIMDGIDEELEDEILWRTVNKAEAAMNRTADGKSATAQVPPEMLNAMQLTGGYIEWLRTDTAEKYSAIEMSDEAKKYITTLAKFIAYLRARPSSRQRETAERELAARLTSQLTRYCKSVAVVLNKTAIDEEVMTRTRQVAMDTARGVVFEVCKYLRIKGEEGAETKVISLSTSMPEAETQNLLRFLGRIKMVELFSPPSPNGIKLRPRWRLRENLVRIWDAAVREQS